MKKLTSDACVSLVRTSLCLTLSFTMAPAPLHAHTCSQPPRSSTQQWDSILDAVRSPGRFPSAQEIQIDSPKSTQPDFVGIPTKGHWTERTIDLGKAVQLATRPDGSARSMTELVQSLWKDFGIRVYVSDSKPSSQTIESARSNPASSQSFQARPGLVDFMSYLKNSPSIESQFTPHRDLVNFQSPDGDKAAQIRFQELFAQVEEARGMFLPPGAKMPNGADRPHPNDPVILMKSFATTMTPKHEFLHFLFHQNRQQQGEADPFYDMPAQVAALKAKATALQNSADFRAATEAALAYKDAEIKQFLMSAGEEADVYRTLVDHADRLKIGLEDKAFALSGYQEHILLIERTVHEQRNALTAFRTKITTPAHQTQLNEIENQLRSAERKLGESKAWLQQQGNALLVARH